MRSLIASATARAQGANCLQRAGEIAERAAARHVRAGENDLVDQPGAEKIRRVGGRRSRSCRCRPAQHDHLRTGAQGIEVGRLLRIERLDRRKRNARLRTCCWNSMISAVSKHSAVAPAVFC